MTAARALGQPVAAGALAALLAGGLSACGSGAARVSGVHVSRVHVSEARLSGAQVFATDCAVCHSISGHSLPQQQGGDLRRLRLPRRELLQYAAEMPVVNGRLTTRDLRAVVSYLQAIERR